MITAGFIHEYAHLKRKTPDFNENRSYALWNVYEAKGTYKIRIFLPGVDKKNVKLIYKSGLLIIKGNKTKINSPECKTLSKQSFSGWFTRCIRLTENIAGKSIRAYFKNGILHIELCNKSKIRRIIKINS